MEKEKVYIVTSGSYSDYSIEKVFKSEEKAKIYSSTISDSRIEEYVFADDLVQGTLDDIFYVYSLTLYFDNTQKSIDERYKFYLSRTPSRIMKDKIRDEKRTQIESNTIKELSTIILKEENFEKALKIAQDRLVEFKAKMEVVF